MSHDCHHDSCSHHHHHHSHGNGCCACSRDVECGCSCHHHHSHKHSDELLALADEAWMEVIKEKIKEEIKKHSGDHLDKIAALVAQTNHARWNHLLGEKENLHTFEDELHNLIYHQK